MRSVQRKAGAVNTFVEETLRTEGYSVQTCWEMKGPKDTSVAFLTMYLVHPPEDGAEGTLMLVQTYFNGGWEAFPQASRSNEINATMDSIKKALR